MRQSSLQHATAVAIGGRAVLLRGPSGSGKSDLALRLIDQGALLVADDQTELYLEQGRLFARAPETIAGQLEVRGLGIVDRPRLAAAPVALLVELRPGEAIERLPEERSETLLGVQLPVIALDPFTASAAAKLTLALERLGPAAPAREAPQPLVLVTGLSGAGRSLALDTLEDLGYEAIDNLPLELVQATLQDSGTSDRPLAIGVDVRTRDFAAGRLLTLLDALLADPRLATRLVFVDCDDETLVRRYTETRRRHPLAQDRPVLDGLQAERRLMQPLRGRADLLFDTSLLAPAEFRRLLAGHLSLAGGTGLGMMTFVTSFSFRQGLPREADLVLDVRFLRNPHYDPRLKPLTGRDPAVAAHIEEDPGFAAFFQGLTAWLGPLLPRYEAEGKTYLTLAVGCTGGRHRSVFVAERLARWLAGLERPVVLAHRDVERGS